jgi:hypothetical protein
MVCKTDICFVVRECRDENYLPSTVDGGGVILGHKSSLNFLLSPDFDGNPLMIRGKMGFINL